MSKLFVATICFAWIICCLIPAGAASSTISFNYQGKLLGGGGEPVPDGSYTLAAAIFAADTGGTALWSGSYTAQVTGGVFSVIIGPLSTDVLSTAEGRWLQVTINGSTLSPRTKLVSVPYAGVAAVATSVTNSSVTTASIADNTVTSAKIADGTIALADITGTGASANHVIKRNSTNTAWTFAPDINTTYTAGAGLSLASGVFSIADTGVTTAKLDDSSVTSVKIKDLTIGTGDIAGGAVTTAKISSSGAATGKALMYDGSSVVWGNPSAASIVLPYTGDTSSASDAFSVTNTGTGRAGYFEADNTVDSTANALEVKANTTGSALYASTTGIATAVEGYASGTGFAGFFQIEHPSSYASAVQAQTDAHGVAI